MCGNSIGMDRRFLAKYMPELDNYVHYRSVDVSSFKELARRWYPAIYRKRPGKAEQHRALGDIQESIEELRYYREQLLPPLGAKPRTPASNPTRTPRRTTQPSNPRSAPTSVVTDCSRAEWPIRPMRQPLPASSPSPPPTSMS